MLLKWADPEAVSANILWWRQGCVESKVFAVVADCDFYVLVQSEMTHITNRMKIEAMQKFLSGCNNNSMNVITTEGGLGGYKMDAAGQDAFMTVFISINFEPPEGQDETTQFRFVIEER